MLKNNKKLPESQEWPKIRVWGYTARNQLDCTMGTSVRNLGPRPLNLGISARCTHSPPVATFQSFARADSTCRISHRYLSLIISHNTAFFMALLSRLEPHMEFAESKSHIRVLVAKKTGNKSFYFYCVKVKPWPEVRSKILGSKESKQISTWWTGLRTAFQSHLNPSKVTRKTWRVPHSSKWAQKCFQGWWTRTAWPE